jgi:regulator of protease activity HflC (stomatin/prohibitin superfamily)
MGSSEPLSPGRVIAGVAALIVIVIGLITGIAALVGVMTAWDSTTAGDVAVIRNGGPFSNSNIRGHIDPASGLTWTGIWSTTHHYPAQQQYYTISATPDQGAVLGVDTVTVPSQDGVNLTLQGTLYYSLNWADTSILDKFDDKFGTRSYPVPNGSSLRAYDGTDGWNAFVGEIIRPVLNNDLRQQIGDFSCSDLVSSCALVDNATQQALNQHPASTGLSNSQNIVRVENAIDANLTTDLNNTLGAAYFTGIRFNLSQVDLPGPVQEQVDQAQAAYAAVSQAQAQKQQASIQAQANQIRQQGYAQCPACAQIDIMKAIPPSITTFAPGAGFAITGK